jgi:CHAT domain-containing protein
MISPFKPATYLTTALLLTGAPAMVSPQAQPAILFAQQSIQNQLERASELLVEGLQQGSNLQYAAALETLEEALTLYQAIQTERGVNENDRRNARRGEADTLRAKAGIYIKLNDPDLGIQLYQESLNIYREIGYENLAAKTASRLGTELYIQGDYQQARAYLEESLVIYQQLNTPLDEASVLNKIALAFQAEGNYDSALEKYQESQNIYASCLPDFRCEEGISNIMTNIASLYTEQENYDAAISIYEGLLLETTNPILAVDLLYNLGIIFYKRGDEEFRAAQFQRSQANEVGVISVQAESYYSQSLAYFQHSLASISQISGHDARLDRALILSSMGAIFERLDKQSLAILFLKETVNIYESIRAENLDLPAELQEAFSSRFASTYRLLADLLLQEDRILQAQRVLVLLKLQELDEYVRGVRSNNDTQAGVPLYATEQDISSLYQAHEAQLIALGQELTELARIDRDQRTPEQQDRVVELRQLEQASLAAFQTFAEQPEIVELVERLRRTESAANLELDELNALRDNLQRLQDRDGLNAVVLYPLVLEDRLELVLVTPGAAPIRRTVKASRAALNRTIGELRYALEAPTRDAKKPAQELYDWLIGPIANDLEQAGADTIIYAPDLRLRYVPLAALYNGEEWLIQNYRVNNITAASLADLDNVNHQEATAVLAAAFTEGSYTVQVGNRAVLYNGLPFAAPEIDNLANLIPQTIRRFNTDFNPNIIWEMDDYDIIHLATHASFNPGPLENSYIMFGNGDRATLADIKRWSFPNVDLVVLSACETAVGDALWAPPAVGETTDQISGEEILGFGYLMQLAGADAAIGSLWKVDDGGTQLLMNEFYEALTRGRLSKVEALQQAQLSLIQMGERGDRGFILAQEIGLNPNDLSHPYYWAPFILIGNGL